MDFRRGVGVGAGLDGVEKSIWAAAAAAALDGEGPGLDLDLDLVGVAERSIWEGRQR